MIYLQLYREVWPSTYKNLKFLSVSDAPEIFASSRCVKIISQIRCSCNSQGNPLPSLVWEIAGEPVNHSADIPIREVSLGGGGMRSVITLYRLDEDMPSLVCLSINSLGSDSFVFNVSSSQTQLGNEICRMMHLQPIWFGFTDPYGLCGPFRAAYYVSVDRLCSGSAGHADSLCPAAAFLLQVRKIKTHLKKPEWNT